MNKMTFLTRIIPLSIIISVGSLYGQDLETLEYDWNEKPEIHALSDSDMNELELVLKQKTIIEYNIEYNYEEPYLYEYYLFHKIIRVNSDDAIESNNKIYIPMDGVTEVVTEKARVITKEGKVITLDKDDIKEAIDEENEESYRYFALEGITKGSEIEFLYLLKQMPNYTGIKYRYQSEIKKLNVEVKVISPSNLIFKGKSYNGFPEMEVDTNYEERNVIFASIDEIPALKSEMFAAYTSNCMSMLYKLYINTSKGRSPVVSYGNAAETVYGQVYAELDKATQKKIKKLVKLIGLSPSDSEDDKIRKIEQYLKIQFIVLEGSDRELYEVKSILDNKVCAQKGMVKLYCAIFKDQGIDNQLVLTSNRFSLKFDPDFEAYNFLNEYLIYFPKTKKHLAPTAVLYRYGFVPYSWRDNYGLYIKAITIGDFVSGIGKVKYIDPLPYDASYDDLKVTVNFDGNFSDLTVDVHRTLGGYYAQNYQPIYDYVDDEQKEEMNESLIKFITEDADIKELEVQNEGTIFFGVEPLIAKGTFVSSNFIEKASDKLLFKVGELIGPQAEMYQEETRKLEVENDFNRVYHREISFNIPDGYEIKNLDVLNIEVLCMKDGKRSAAFLSNYSIDGDQVNVAVEEYYKDIIYTLEQFEDFRNVINAAADFNKIVLFLEKK